MKKITELLLDNIKVLIAGIAALAVIIIAAVIMSVAFGGETMRSLSIKDIQGDVVIIRGSKHLMATKKTVLKSGDVVNTGPNGSVRIALDPGKYIAIEPDSSVYVYYTEISDKGEISVNIGCGAVTCQLNSPLTKKETFCVKTPNAAINVRGTVFRTEFSMKEKYLGYSDVMLTHVQNFDGSVMLQLYNVKGEKTDEPMLLTERTSAELISCSEFAQYGYINYDTDMYALDEITVKELIRINGEHPIAYTLDELNTALRAIRRRISDQQTATTTDAPTETESESISSSAVKTERTERTSRTSRTTRRTEERTSVTTEMPAVTAPPFPETEETTTAVPQSSVTEAPYSETEYEASSTMQTQIYTTYPGPKWWNMPNYDPSDESDEDEDLYIFTAPER